MGLSERDTVDRIVSQWLNVRPDLDTSPMAVIGRLSRLARLIDRRLADNFEEYGLEGWSYDVLATLRRAGPPFERPAGELVGNTMVTTGAITNRIDRLEERGLVERARTTDRRKVIVRLTPQGVGLVDEAAGPHLEFERILLVGLEPAERETLRVLLRKLLLELGDRADDV